jgi:hypothetical protein
MSGQFEERSRTGGIGAGQTDIWAMVTVKSELESFKADLTALGLEAPSVNDNAMAEMFVRQEARTPHQRLAIILKEVGQEWSSE